MIYYLYIILFSAYSHASISMSGAFILGILVDMWRGNTLGITSLVFTAIAFAIHLYKRKFNPQAPGFLLLFSMMTYFISEMVVGGGSGLSLRRIGMAAVLVVSVIIFWFIIRKLLWVQQSEKGKILR